MMSSGVSLKAGSISTRKNKFEMKIFLNIILLLMFMGACSPDKGSETRTNIELMDGWKFINTEIEGGEEVDLNIRDWQDIRLPHDWAISGNFDELNDIQEAMVLEDGERVKRMRRGRTGGLPHVGTGWYRKVFKIPGSFSNKRIHIEFDGAMSHAKVYINGTYVGEWPYGYSSFGFDITDQVRAGKSNTLAVRLENKPLASRWYPGAGIYRNVRLVITDQIYVKRWGTHITTPEIKPGEALVNLKTSIHNKSGVAKKIVCTD